MPPADVGQLVFVMDVEHPELDAADRHHLQKALRLRVGDPFVVADGAGSWRPVRFGDPVEVAGEVVVDPRPDPPLTVGLTPTKGDRPEWAVQKLTELSIDHIVILRTERSVIRWKGDRVAHHLERIRRIAREAAMQSRGRGCPRSRASTRSPIIPAPPWPTPVVVPPPGATGSCSADRRGAVATGSGLRRGTGWPSGPPSCGPRRPR